MAKNQRENDYVFEKALEATDKKGNNHTVAVLRSKDGRVVYTNILGPTGRKWLDSLPDYQPSDEEDDVEF